LFGGAVRGGPVHTSPTSGDVGD